MNIFKIISDLLFTLFGQRLVGYRTKIVAVITFVTGLLTYFSTDFVTLLCNSFSVCLTSDNKLIAFTVMAMSALQYIMRLFSNTEDAPAGRFLKRFTSNYKDEVRMLKR